MFLQPCGHIEIDNLENFDGEFGAAITDDTQYLAITLSSPIQDAKFVSGIASDKPVVSWRAEVRVHSLWDNYGF